MATNAHTDFPAPAVDDLLPRHRSEQYFTSAQFFAHALRHVISRPQATHNFVGSDALLPLKLITKHRLRDCVFRPPRIVLATLPNEVNALGLLMVEALLAPEGVQCVSLGTQVPIPEIAAAAVAFEADVVARSFSASVSSKQAVASLESLRSVVPTTTAIWVGGELIRRIRRDIPGITPTGTLADMLAALRQWRAERAIT